MRKPKSIILAISGATIFTLSGFLLGRIWTLWSMDEIIDWPATFEACSNIAQVLALAIGGWWTYRLFVRQRVDKARANISHDIQSAVLPGDQLRFIRVVVNIHNIGNVELRPPSGYTEVQCAEFDPNPSSVQWSSIDEKRDLPFKADGLVLEPGETERYSVDFIVPCNHYFFQIHTRVECGGHHQGEFWDETSLCSGNALSSHAS